MNLKINLWHLEKFLKHMIKGGEDNFILYYIVINAQSQYGRILNQRFFALLNEKQDNRYRNYIYIMNYLVFNSTSIFISSDTKFLSKLKYWIVIKGV